jgi:hypothetical protein
MFFTFLAEFKSLLIINPHFSHTYSLSFKEELIEEFENKIDWYYISRYQKLSEEFIEKFQDKIYWYWISREQKLSEKFIENI